MACGTLASRDGEQAAEGQTARWRLAALPGCELLCELAPDLARMRSAWLPKKAALEDDSTIEALLPKTLPGIEGKKTESLTPS